MLKTLKKRGVGIAQQKLTTSKEVIIHAKIMSKITVIKDTGISTFHTKKHNGYVHIGVNSPHESRREVNTKISNVLK